MLLAGHNHHASSAGRRRPRHAAGGALVVQAGTATSTRVREQEQSFNTIDIDDGVVTLHRRTAWNGDDFKPADAQRYQRDEWQLGGRARRAAH